MDEELGTKTGAGRIRRILLEELGKELGPLMDAARAAQEAWDTEQRPGEGLRERKRRLTRQRISDVATTLFATRGFNQVRVSDIAEIVGVSEKTIYNYFPTKESLVLDRADELVERLTSSLREREPGETVLEAAVRDIKRDMRRFERIPDKLLEFFPGFFEMIANTPPLRAAWADVQNRIVAVAAEEFARSARVDPHDPEPQIFGHALAGLGEVSLEARMRYVRQGLRGKALTAAVERDIDRAAALLENGIMAFEDH